MTQQEEREWEKVQEKTFTKWVNERLVKGGYREIRSIFSDLCDGVSLAHLLMALQGDEVEYNPKPYTRIQKMENVERALSFIKKKKVKLINIGPSDIVDGNHKLILGLVWSLIARLAIADMADLGDLSIRKELLKWCRDVTFGYESVNIVDFSGSWQDGVAFNAIIHRFRPEFVPNFHDLKASERVKNLDQAFRIAEQNLDIKRLLDVEDVADVSIPDERSIMTYVSSYYQKFKEYEREKGVFNRVKSILEMVDRSIQLRNLYEIKARNLLPLVKELSRQRKEICGMVRNLSGALNSLWETNAKVVSGSAEIYALLGSVNAIHSLYRLKRYTPPPEVSLSKLSFPPLSPNNIADNVELRRLFDPFFQSEVETGNKVLELFKQIFAEGRTPHDQIEDGVELHNKLVTMNFSDPVSNLQCEQFKSIIENKIEVLNKVKNKDLEEERVIENAIGLYKRLQKKGEPGISPNDLYCCLNQLGLSIDENMISFASPDGYISFDEYITIVRETNRASFEPVELKKAFEMFSMAGDILDLKSLNLKECDLRNIYYFNKNDPELSINEFFERFIGN